MHLELSDDHKMIQKTAREFAEKEVKPRAHEIDESGEFPRATFGKAAELGFTRVCASTGVILSVCNTLFCDPILRFGTEEQKKKYVTPHARGEKVGEDDA